MEETEKKDNEKDKEKIHCAIKFDSNFINKKYENMAIKKKEEKTETNKYTLNKKNTC